MSESDKRTTVSRFLMQVLWPSFVGAGIAVGILFSYVDPEQIDSVYLNGSREAGYTVGFVFLWLMFMLACSLTWFLTRSGNRRK